MSVLASLRERETALTIAAALRMEKLLNWSFIGKEQMTGLPEYRNGT